jgi:2-methylisocitrate lyase-like PEP mutase family enzyme
MGKLLDSAPPPTRRLKERLAHAPPVLAPGAYDALTARLVEEAGFPAVYMTGFGTAAARLGRPDVGLVTMTEMVDTAKRMTEAVSIPVIADADTGYGNPINVIRTVREYEAVGVAAIQIEDQEWPKKCGHMEDKRVIPAADMVEKVRAAAAARRSEDFLVIARTDARAVLGVDEALDRARRYRDAGADLLFVEALESEDEIARAAAALGDVPLVFNWAEGGKTPPLELERLRQLGFRLAIFPISTLLTTVRAVGDVLARIRAAGTPLPVLAELPTFGEFLDFIGLPEIQDLERRFATAASVGTPATT